MPPGPDGASDAPDGGADKTVQFDSDVWTQGFTIVPNVVLTNASISAPGFRVYALFLYYAREDESCWPGQDGLASVAGVSERTVRSAIRELEETALVETRRRGQGKTNVYVLLEPRNSRSRPANLAGQDRQNLPIPKRNKTQGEQDAGELVRLRDVWRSNAPPLIEHRLAYLNDDKSKRALLKALTVYDADTIASAIMNYATVLAGDEYRWDYSWTLRDFLQRGLDRFVPEADPLRNFRRRNGENRRPTRDDFPEFK